MCHEFIEMRVAQHKLHTYQLALVAFSQKIPNDLGSMQQRLVAAASHQNKIVDHGFNVPFPVTAAMCKKPPGSAYLSEKGLGLVETR